MVEMRPTLATISEEAGVSKATVSLALNGSSLVSKETAKRVIEIARRYNYHPNAIARSLAIGKSGVITLFVVGSKEHASQRLLSSSWMFYNPIIKSISLILSRAKYHFQFEILNPNYLSEQEVIEQHIQEGASDGIILLCFDEFNYSVSGFLENAHCPIVTVNRKLSEKISSFQIDNFMGAKNATDYLIMKGHIKIAHIRGPYNSYNSEERKRGFIEAMTEYGLDIPESFIPTGDWTIDSGYASTLSLMEKKDPPTALFCANDNMAIGALQALRELRLHVPEDVSVVGFDDSEISRVIQPSLTTIRQPLEELGSLAAAEVLTQMANDERQHIIIEPKLIERSSCCLIKN